MAEELGQAPPPVFQGCVAECKGGTVCVEGLSSLLHSSSALSVRSPNSVLIKCVWQVKLTKEEWTLLASFPVVGLLTWSTLNPEPQLLNPDPQTQPLITKS